MKVSISSLLVAMGTAFIGGAANATPVIDKDAPKTIVADRVIYNVKTKSVATSGTTTMTDTNGNRMTLVDAYMDENGTAAGTHGASISLGQHTRIDAETIKKDGDITTANDIDLTACYKCDADIEAWEISASSMKHDNVKHTIYLYDPLFRMYGIPIFWFPALSYPDPTVKHKSGLIMPDFQSTNHMGVQFNIPLYLSFSDYHDMTITGSILTDENPLWQIEHRLNTDHMSFLTTGSYTYNRAHDSRWHIFNNDLIELGNNARLNIFVQRASDKLYLQKYGFYDSQPYLDSGARAELFGESGYVSAAAHVFQELRANNERNKIIPSGDILPNIHGTYQTDTLFANTRMNFNADLIGINNEDTGSAVQRLLGIAAINSPWTLPYGARLMVNASARYDLYNFSDANTNMGNNFYGIRGRFLPSGYGDLSWAFMQRKTHWTNVIEPRLRYAVRAHANDSAFINMDSSGSLLSDATLFSDNRLSGYDLWENGNYMDYGANWTSYSDEGITINAFMGQTYNFETPADLDPNSGFHDGASDYVGRASINWKNKFSVTNRFRFAENGLALRHLETVGRIGDERNYISAGYIRATQLIDAVTVDKTLNEFSGGFGLGITGRLSIHAGATYNITDNRLQKITAGVYYDHPCYTIGLEYYKDGAIRYNVDGTSYVGASTVRFGFSLKLSESAHNSTQPVTNEQWMARNNNEI